MTEQTNTQGSVQEQKETQEVQTLELDLNANPFDDASWSQDLIESNSQTQSAQTEPKAEDLAEPAKPSVDYSAFVKENFGFESIDELKQVVEKAKTVKEEVPVFTNEESKAIYAALLDGKEDDVFTFLAQKKEIEKIASLSVDNVDSALAILKLKMKQDYKELSDDDIDFKLNKKFSFPEKPEKEFGEEDEMYEKRLALYERELNATTKELLIEAKMAKPSIENLKTKLELPDVLKIKQAEALNPSQEEIDKLQQQRQLYLDSLNKANFEGYKVTAKDEEVELPISYTIDDAEKGELKNVLKEFDVEDFMWQRWSSEDGNLNVTKAMDDVYLLKNKDKIFQKIANEAVAQFKVEMIKNKKQISLNTPAPAFNPQQGQVIAEEEAKALFGF